MLQYSTVEKCRSSERVWKIQSTEGSLGLKQPALGITDLVQQEQELTQEALVNSYGLCLHDFPLGHTSQHCHAGEQATPGDFAGCKPHCSLSSTFLLIETDKILWSRLKPIPGDAHNLQEYRACPPSLRPPCTWLFWAAVRSHISSVWLNVPSLSDNNPARFRRQPWFFFLKRQVFSHSLHANQSHRKAVSGPAGLN